MSNIYSQYLKQKMIEVCKILRYTMTFDTFTELELHGIVQHDVLPRELQQHRVVEELVDGDVL